MPRFDDPRREAEWRSKLAQRAKEQWASPEGRVKKCKGMSEAMKKRWADPEIGSEMRENLREAAKKQWADPVKRERIVQARKRAIRTSEYRQRRSELTKKLWVNPEFRARQHETRSKIYRTPEQRLRASTVAKRLWRDEEKREALIRTMQMRRNDPEYRARLSAKVKTLWCDPGYRERMRMCFDDPEERRKRSETARAYWHSLSPEEQEQRTAKLREMASLGYWASRRANPSGIELLVADVLDKLGVSYVQQKQIGPYIVDFLLRDYNAILECYGDYWHNRPDQVKKDHRRQKYLEKCGHRVIVLWEHNIRSDALGLVLRMLDTLKASGDPP